MKKVIKRLFGELTNFSLQQLDKAKALVEGVTSDLKDLSQLTEKKARKLVDSICDDERIYSFVHGFLDSAKDSHENAVLWLRQNWDSMQEYLNNTVKEKPKTVGFLDGVAHIFLAIPATRHLRSGSYKEYVNYGRAVGAILSVTLFLPGFTVRGVVGLVPYATRIVKYFKEKSEESQPREETGKKKAKKRESSRRP